MKSRKLEGRKIEKEIKSNLNLIKKINSKLIKLESKNKKEHFENYKKRIKIVLSQNDLELDDSKLYKEIAIFSDKYDISEETSRINIAQTNSIHILKMRIILKKLIFYVRSYLEKLIHRIKVKQSVDKYFSS